MSLRIVPLYVWSLLVFLLPGSAVLGFVQNRRNIRPLYALILLLCSSCATGYLSFWIYFASPACGRVFSFVVAGAAVIFLVRAYSRNSGFRNLLRQIRTPFLYVAVVGLCYLALLYIPADPFKTGQDLTDWRFFSALRPGDNIIPWIFADRLYHHASVIPFCCGDWLSSDRPPLQAGIFLYYWRLKLISGSGLNYQLLCTGLQCLWICGVWALLTSLRAGAIFKAVIALLAPTAFLFYNCLYVWPKLLAATLILFAASILMTVLWERRRLSVSESSLFAFCVALALMAHPGSVFSLPCFAVLAIVKAPQRYGRAFVCAAAILTCFALPWRAYQKYVDPPGNRLMKMHLAGVVRVDTRTTIRALKDSYRNTPPRTIFQNKIDNLERIIGPAPVKGFGLQLLLPSNFNNWQAIENVRIHQREGIWNAIGFLNIGWLALPFVLSQRTTGAVPHAGWLLVCACANLVCWSLIIFGPAGTITTHSSYADILLLMTGLSAFLISMPRWIPLCVMLINAFNTAILWVPVVPHSPNFSNQTQWALLIFGIALWAALLIHFSRVLLQTHISVDPTDNVALRSIAAQPVTP